MRIFGTCVHCGKVANGEDISQHDYCVDPQCQAWYNAVLDGHDDDAARLEREIDAQWNAPPALAAAACYYAQHYGWPVFPLKPGTKEPATPHGFEDATTDLRHISARWRRNPNYNIGTPTGITFDVFDVDEGADQWYQLRRHQHSDEVYDPHGIAETPRHIGGLHVFLLPTGGGNWSKRLPGCDFRGRGGYVVLAPSVLDEYDGRRYRWRFRPSDQIKVRKKA
ncbi:hypothetical protein GCM10012275_28660 [Longimycelium tulufanense]|uniref:DNA primase/polymerase bifunctional N-terminal domain-containing protein n=1 Tax=Longimycelium tulufanense TaxID=907463 RepID=A0A8J3CCZ8_9PSEU|nr:bifunctional DNA primase/polymerase [Longimycelium tulufanense]GGM55820.1 hypothetical protein GCM10012275_28660 [Longimycelium tulufanense]